MMQFVKSNLRSESPSDDISQVALEELQARNIMRAKEMIAEMGNKYLCHPNNQIKKKKAKRQYTKKA
jgi:hypothetical protein